MATDWSIVKREHVIEACNLYDMERRIPPRPSRNTFLLLNGRRYPAKFIRGVAYELATGRKLNPNIDYEGGKQTADFFKRLGFDIEYKGKDKPAFHVEEPAPELSSHFNGQTNNVKNSTFDPTHQKNALKKLLEQRFGLVQTEVKFDWLVVPERNSMDQDFATIADALVNYRGFNNFFTPRISLKCDYYIPSQNLIIEYDERQHFTIPRDITLSLYPPNLELNFDMRIWRDACQIIQARDNDPVFRDEQRAFYMTFG